MEQPVNPPSKSHITWFEGYEYFLTDGITLAQALPDAPIGEDGYRWPRQAVATTYEEVRQALDYMHREMKPGDPSLTEFLATYQESEPDPTTVAYTVACGRGVYIQATIDRYLGFGARVVAQTTAADGTVVFLVRSPKEHIQWQAGRFASGMYGTGTWRATLAEGQAEATRLLMSAGGEMKHAFTEPGPNVRFTEE